MKWDAPASEATFDQLAELGALYRLTDELYRAQSIDAVYEAALEAILTTLHCSQASVLLFDAAGVMQFVAWRGLSEAYRSALRGHSPWKPGEPDPQPIFVSDIDRTDEAEWVKATIKAEGIRALGFIPLVSQGVVIGKFMTYYGVPHQFAEHEIGLAVTIARQVGLSLERFRAEQARQVAEQELRESEQRFRLMSEQAPVMIWMSHADGSCLHLNRMLRTFWNVNEDSVAAFDWQTMMHPDDAGEITARIAEGLSNRVPVSIKGRFCNATGEWRVLQTDARPRIGANGEFLGMIGVNVDITEREQTETTLRESEERFRLAVEAAPSGMVMTDADGRVVMVNANAADLFGYTGDELVGRKIEILVPERFRTSHPKYRRSYGDESSVRPMGAGRELFGLRKDGSEVPVEIGLSPIETPDGVRTIAAIVDISSRKRAEAQRELLLAELNHRVKNTLAVVQAIAHQTFRDGNGAQARSAFEGRLSALAAAHNLLTQSNWESAPLQQLLVAAVHTHGTNGRALSFTGPEVLLSPKQALAMAMAMHELFTNAVKYGALSCEEGSVVVDWRVAAGAEPRLNLVWREADGPPVVAPTTRGFGSLLLERTLALDLGGQVTMEFRAEGIVCAIEAPLPQGADLGPARSQVNALSPST